MSAQLAPVLSQTSYDLPKVRGRYQFDVLLSKMTWFKVGGPVDILFRPADIEDLVHFLKNKPSYLEMTILGAGSNILVRDGGLRGCLIKLTGTFAHIDVEGNQIIAGAACLDRTLAMHCAYAGLSGLEFLVGIPGTVGGAIAMNAGAYGSEIKDTLQWVEMVDDAGAISRVQSKDISMTYRHAELPKNVMITRACFELTWDDPKKIMDTTTRILAQKENDQPLGGRTGGSTFKNPTQGRAWELIDTAGCRGLRFGDAQISEKHCNFMLNLNTARAYDLEMLGEQVRHRVKEKTGVELDWEIIRLGDVA